MEYKTKMSILRTKLIYIYILLNCQHFSNSEMNILEQNIGQIINNVNTLKILSHEQKEYQLKLVLNIIELLKTIYMTNINYSDFYYSYCVCVKKYLDKKIKDLLLLFKEEETTIESNIKCFTVDESKDECKIIYDNQNIQCIVINDDDDDVDDDDDDDDDDDNKKELTPQINCPQTKIVKNIYTQNKKETRKRTYSSLGDEFLKRNIEDFLSRRGNKKNHC